MSLTCGHHIVRGMRAISKQLCGGFANRLVPHRTFKHQEAGLTLVEMIVVLAIIALVAALIVPNVIGRPDEARVTVANTDMKTIATALRMYRLDNGDYPTTEQGLAALVARPSIPPAPRAWSPEGYLAELPSDPWGRPYAYRGGGAGIELKSLGKDGEPGGEGLDADLVLKR